MQTVGMTWQHACETSAVLASLGLGLALSKRPRVKLLGALIREAAMIGLLYGLWQLAGRVSVDKGEQAFARAQWIERFERHLPLPSEHTLQQVLLPHKLPTQLANLYYAGMHFPVMFAFLLWLFLRHRHRYRPVRQTMAWATLLCLAVQLMPVAPPRMLPGYVDTAMLYDQSVYSSGFAVDQLSAMPSVHVCWAVLIGWYVWRISPSRWRWIGPLHAAIVVFVVGATANHWWLDGIVAVALLGVAAWGVLGAHVVSARILSRLLATKVGRGAIDSDGASAPSGAGHSDLIEPPSTGMTQPVR